MKEYGISVVQFVLAGRKQELHNLLSILSTEAINSIVTEFFLMESFFNKLSKATFTDFSALPETVLVNGVTRKMTEQDFIRAHRKYALGKDVPTFELISEATYNECLALLEEHTILEHSDLKLLNLEPKQKIFISELASHLFNTYRLMKFDSLKQFSDVSDSPDKILSTAYANTYHILKKYSKINEYDTELLRQTHAKIGRILAVLSGVDSKNVEVLVTSIQEIIRTTSKPQSILNLIDSSIPDMSLEEFIEVLAIIRDEANLPGIDVHAEHFLSDCYKISKSSVVSLEPARVRHLEMLERDLDSVLYYSERR